MSDTPIDSAEFRRVLGHYPTGVTLVTGVDAAGPVGMVVGSFGSVSLDPPLVMFMPTTTSTTWQRIEPTRRFCVNVLCDDQVEMCNAFFSKVDHVWDDVAWHPAPSGSPIIDSALAWVDCEVDSVLEAGDHVIVLGRVVALGADDTDRTPIVFFKGGYGRYAS
ncbi:MAG: flavin reductase family protein [Acidimicrobiia bacterium]|nr:flavin reductase family protein [Acidimicrobiia bacterium]